jgi:hypothetical protein
MGHMAVAMASINQAMVQSVSAPSDTRQTSESLMVLAGRFGDLVSDYQT